jgi:hypothetical protein
MVPGWHVADLVRLPPKVVADGVFSAVGQMDLPFLVQVPAAGMHITVQGVSALPDPIEERMPDLHEGVKGELAAVDAFDATLAEPNLGYGGVFAMYCQRSGSMPYVMPLGQVFS